MWGGGIMNRKVAELKLKDILQPEENGILKQKSQNCQKDFSIIDILKQFSKTTQKDYDNVFNNRALYDRSDV
jgi:hypothetical protein